MNVWGDAASTRTLLDAARGGAVPVSEARFLWGDAQLYVFFYASDLDLQVRATSRDGPVWKDDSIALSVFIPVEGSPAGVSGRKYMVQVTAAGIVADAECPADALDVGDVRCTRSWQSGARAESDCDGTINDPNDFDEEWTLEIALPLKAFARALEDERRLRVSLRRCEIAYDGARSCGEWGSGRQPATLTLVGGGGPRSHANGAAESDRDADRALRVGTVERRGARGGLAPPNFARPASSGAGQ